MDARRKISVDAILESGSSEGGIWHLETCPKARRSDAAISRYSRTLAVCAQTHAEFILRKGLITTSLQAWIVIPQIRGHPAGTLARIVFEFILNVRKVPRILVVRGVGIRLHSVLRQWLHGERIGSVEVHVFFKSVGKEKVVAYP